jgi:hypothetical protein
MTSTFLLLLLVIFVGQVACVDIYFNTSSVGCDGPTGCSWFDPEIWVGGIIPALEIDVAHILDERPNIRVNYNNNFKIFLDSVYLSGVTLEIINSTFSVDAITLTNATLQIDQRSSFHSYEDTSVAQNSTIILQGGTFEQEASGVEFTLDASSFLIANQRSILILYLTIILSPKKKIIDPAHKYIGNSSRNIRSSTEQRLYWWHNCFPSLHFLSQLPILAICNIYKWGKYPT